MLKQLCLLAPGLNLQAVVQLSSLTKLNLSATALPHVPSGPYLSTNLEASWVPAREHRPPAWLPGVR